MPRKKKNGRPPRKPPASDREENAIIVKGRARWKNWVRRLAEHDRKSMSDLIDHALVRYARELGFEEAPPR